MCVSELHFKLLMFEIRMILFKLNQNYSTLQKKKIQFFAYLSNMHRVRIQKVYHRKR